MKAFIRKNAIPLFAISGAINIGLILAFIIPIFIEPNIFRGVKLSDVAERIVNYENHPGRIKTTCRKCPNCSDIPLRSFVLNVDSLKHMMLKDRFLGRAKNRYSKILLIPTMDSANSSERNIPYFSFLFAGIDEYNGIIDTENMYNYCDPCPNKCNVQNTGYDIKWTKFEQEIKDAHPDFKDFSFAETCN